jgi:hypothetical protein
MDDVRKLVKVKPLEWRKSGETWTAMGGIAFYTVRRCCLYTGQHYSARLDSDDDAKAAAQADYEARIYAALTPASDGRAEGLREAAGIAEAFMSQWATATYQNMDARMQNAAKTYAAGDIVSAILARAAELEGNTDE